MTATVLLAGVTKLSTITANNAMQYLTGSLIGAGSDKTFIEVDGSSIAAVTTATNPFYALMFGSPNQPLVRPTIQGFTLVCTVPGKPFGGMRVSATQPDILDVKVQGFPGTANTPPGETTQMNLWRCTGARLYDVELDGQGEGALGLGLNNCEDTVCDGVDSHHMAASHGFSAWQCSRVVYNDCRAFANGGPGSGQGGVGFNWEEGTSPSFHNNSASYDNEMGAFRFNGKVSGGLHTLNGLFIGAEVFAGGATSADVAKTGIFLNA